MMIDIEELSPCINCKDKICGLIDGNECEKYWLFRKIKETFKEVKTNEAN